MGGGKPPGRIEHLELGARPPCGGAARKGNPGRGASDPPNRRPGRTLRDSVCDVTIVEPPGRDTILRRSALTGPVPDGRTVPASNKRGNTAHHLILFRLRQTRRGLLGAALCALLLSGCTTAGPKSAQADYAKNGPFRTATSQVEAPNGDGYVVFRPVAYERVPFLSPIVTWGNGTGAQPDFYRTLLVHLASWGFTVIASTLPNTGDGRQILGGAQYLIKVDQKKASLFYHHLNTRELAAVGQSQGATGAVRAAEIGGRLIATVVTFSLPWNGQGPVGTKWDRPGSLGWSGPNPDCATAEDCWADPSALRQPTFLISTRGPLDSVIANPGVERCYFQDVHAQAALGIIRSSMGRRADHNSIQDSDRGGAPDAFLGPTTAWLLDQLLHDKQAALWFDGKHSFFEHNPVWEGSVVKTVWSPHPGCG